MIDEELQWAHSLGHRRLHRLSLHEAVILGCGGLTLGPPGQDRCAAQAGRGRIAGCGGRTVADGFLMQMFFLGAATLASPLSKAEVGLNIASYGGLTRQCLAACFEQAAGRLS